MKYRIIIEGNTTLDELKTQIENGSRFILFPYCVSIFAFTFRKFSPAFLIKKDEDTSKHIRKFNLYTILLGWWGFPWGPIYSVKALHASKKGGLDVTDDIMLNIDNDSLLNREVELKLTNQIYCKPEKGSLKTFKDTLCKDFENDNNVKKIIIGKYINTNSPFYIIGVQIDNDIEKYIEKFRISLSKQFMKHVRFEFVNLDETDDDIEVLKKQGEILINKIGT